MLNLILNLYYLVVTLIDDAWRAAKGFVRNWAQSRYR